MKIFKKNNIYGPALAASMLLTVTGCIEETTPADGSITEDQIVSAGLESAVNGISTQMTQGYLVYGTNTHESDMS